MSDPPILADIVRFVPELRRVPVFSDLTEDQLSWLARHMEEVRLDAGEVYGRPGDPIEHLFVLLEGELQGERPGMPGSPIFTATAGHITGLLPFSRLSQFKGLTRAVLPTRGLRLHKRHFPEMLARIPVVAERLVALMSDRIREYTRMETQQDKLMALGKLSAGLAHELNNPAAAARRAAQDLMGAMDKVRAASMKLMHHVPDEAQRNAILRFDRDIGESARANVVPPSPLERSDREEAIGSWLEQHGVSEPWEIAATLADAGLTPDKLDGFASTLDPEIVGPVLHRTAAISTVYGLIQEIDNSTRRISELVAAVKRYSYMDQSPIQEVDLTEDIENTLKIFAHRLKKGITVVREYDAQLPRVCAFASELNQVWTNLIDNAIDAMGGKGELRIQTTRELDSVVVEIRDNGPGVPLEIQSRIFEPFFTTKGVGDGTGLGLDTALRIVRKHHGYIELKSVPGDTRFRVRLPIQQPKAQAQVVEEPS